MKKAMYSMHCFTHHRGAGAEPCLPPSFPPFLRRPPRKHWRRTMSSTTATSARSWPRTASPVTAPTAPAARPGLRLDQREAAIEAEAIKPGTPEKSELVQRILAADPGESDAAAASRGKKLTAAQKDLLRRWIAAGAEYQPHWSFIAPVRPEPPAVKNAAWVRNPDRPFILAKLEATRPASRPPKPTGDAWPAALSFDLTGLPPPPADVEAFVNDTAPPTPTSNMSTGCWRRRSGANIAARYWLDAARYADTHGIHFDNFREMWAYRDWVIGAFNAQPAVRPVHHRAAGRRPAAQSDPRPAHRHRLQPLQHHHQRRRRDRRGVSGPLRPRPHRNDGRRSGWG